MAAERKRGWKLGRRKPSGKMAVMTAMALALAAVHVAGCGQVLGLEETSLGHAGATAGAAGASGAGGQAGTGANAGAAGTGGSGGGSVASEGPSCEGMTGKECQGESCCTSLQVPGGAFMMGRGDKVTDACPAGMTCADDEQPEHSATVDSFYLDKYEVTVGRFRRFLEAYDDWRAAGNPVSGAGAHSKISGSGWQATWSDKLPADKASLQSALHCGSQYSTWTDAAESHEQNAITCVSWYEALAFCIWDRGTLPTEAEWEFAAAGGSENRLYPWGNEMPDGTRANYIQGSNSRFIDVGSKKAGAGRWGHMDLAGGMIEWGFDWYGQTWYTDGGSTCENCANLNENYSRVLRGGDWNASAGDLRAAKRSGNVVTNRNGFLGIRCARLL